MAWNILLRFKNGFFQNTPVTVVGCLDKNIILGETNNNKKITLAVHVHYNLLGSLPHQNEIQSSTSVGNIKTYIYSFFQGFPVARCLCSAHHEALPSACTFQQWQMVLGAT